MSRDTIRNLILNNLRNQQTRAVESRKPRDEKPVRTVTLYM